MLSLRNRFGIPGVISVIALVFALVGGAYAAENSGSGASASAKKNNRAKKRKAAGLNAKQKRQVIALAKRFASAGPQGPQGVPGLPGAPGAKGADGDDGSNGSNGSDGADGSDGVDGNTVLSGPGNPSPELGSDGDFYIRTTTQQIFGPKTAGSWGSPTSLAGEDGNPWAVGGTLPAGETLTGAWAVGGKTVTVAEGGAGAAPGKRLLTTASFPISLAAPIASGNAGLGPGTACVPLFAGGPDHPECRLHYINQDGMETLPSAYTSVVAPTFCGSGLGEGVDAGNPQAAAGHMCVYAAKETGADKGFISNPASTATSPSNSETSTSGAIISLRPTAVEASAWGTWAVTAPNP